MLACGLIRSSFVSERGQRQLRDLTRHRKASPSRSRDGAPSVPARTVVGSPGAAGRLAATFTALP
ncbi:MAG: hypothetical protein EA424_13285 [Planctomycetaceae bacterium]|nr:MAG: hypothetical protein EA424_13285 [Planctomycetaceae bacterium]